MKNDDKDQTEKNSSSMTSPAERLLQSIAKGEKLTVHDIEPDLFHLLLDAGHNLIFKSSSSENDGRGVDKIGQYSGTKTIFDNKSEFPYTRNLDDGFKYIVIPLKNCPTLSLEEKTELSKTYIKEFDCLCEISKYEVVKSFVLSFDTSGMIELLEKYYPYEESSIKNAISVLTKKLKQEVSDTKLTQE